ncbi:MAG: FCD domain-containing protein [Sneathiella sp.]
MKSDQQQLGEKESVATMASVAIDRLRYDILGGAFAPSTRLRVAELKERYGVGGSPMREALSRLVAEGLVHNLNQRGFRVAPISEEDLLDITETRIALEGAAVTRAIERGDDVWEGSVLGAFHRIDKFFSQHPAFTPEEISAWEEVHSNFHHTLISACGSPRLILFCGQLYDQATRYRRLLLDYKFEPREVVEEHRALLDIVLSRDAETAKSVLQKHIAMTADIVLSTEPGSLKGMKK